MKNSPSKFTVDIGLISVELVFLGFVHGPGLTVFSLFNLSWARSQLPLFIFGNPFSSVSYI